MNQTGQRSGDATGGPTPRGRFLVAVDVDGTLLDTEFEDRLRPREIAAIDAVTSAGHVCALCTGRNSLSIQRLLDSGGDGLQDLPLVLLNGAMVIGGEPRRTLRHQMLARPILHRLVEIFRAHETVAMIYDTDDRGGRLYHEDKEANSVLSSYLARRRDRLGACVAVADLLQNLPESALEVGTIDTAERVAGLTRQIRRELGDQVKVVNTESLISRETYRWAEVYHHICSKGEGVLLLAREYGIPASNIIAVGDNYNDLDLFAVARHSVAMANAPADVQTKADRIAPQVTESGAAVILEEIAAGKYPPGELD